MVKRITVIFLIFVFNSFGQAEEEEPIFDEASPPPLADAIVVPPPADIAPPPTPPVIVQPPVQNANPPANQGVFTPGGSRGNQNKIIKSTADGTGKIQADDDPDGSGDLWEGFSISTNFTYSSFDDDVIGSKGHYDTRSISISKSISDLTIGFEYSEDRYNYGRKASIRKTMLRSTTLYTHYSFNENYGLGGYGFYQTVDIEDQNANSFSWGAGAIFTTYHDIYDFSLQSATSLSWVDFDVSEEAVLYCQLGIYKDLSDWCNVGVYAAFSDSFAEKEDLGLDRTYWNGGIESRFFFDDFFISVGYSKTFQLSGYKDNTLNVGLTYSF